MIEQVVILCGGAGSRLGDLTTKCPKPMLPINDVPFLDYLIRHVSRFGFKKILLLAGINGAIINRTYNHKSINNVDIEVHVESSPMGTGGSIIGAFDKIDDTFVLMNGDTFVDFDMSVLHNVESQFHMMGIHVNDISRYGQIDHADGMVVNMIEKGSSGAGIINAGIYKIDKNILTNMQHGVNISLENNVLPELIIRERVSITELHDVEFIDIGIPEDYALAQTKILEMTHKPAIFLDRDGTLNVDNGYTHLTDELEWISGAVDTIEFANKNNYYVFVVTNQSGVARNFYRNKDILSFHNQMQSELLAHGAHIDGLKWCPCHIDGCIEEYSYNSYRRKPNSGMLNELIHEWNIDIDKSIMLGDSDSDIVAATANNITSNKFNGGNLFDCAKEIIHVNK